MAKDAAKPTGGSPDKAKQAKKEAFMKKRVARLTELKDKEPKKYLTVLNFKEAKDAAVTFAGADGKEVKVTNKKTFCHFKARAQFDYWENMATKPAVSEKVLARKRARLEKLKKMMEALEEEVGGDDEGTE